MSEKRKRTKPRDEHPKNYWTAQRQRSQKVSKILATLLRRDPEVNTTPGTDNPARITPRGEVRQLDRNI